MEIYKLVELVGPGGRCKVAEKDVARYLTRPGWERADRIKPKPAPEVKAAALENEPEEEGKLLSEMTKSELIEVAEDMKIDSRGSKRVLLARIEKVLEGEEEEE